MEYKRKKRNPFQTQRKAVPKRKRRKHSKEFKREAVKLVSEQQISVERTHRVQRMPQIHETCRQGNGYDAFEMS